MSRLEGELKVTGDAHYTADYMVSGLLYGYVVNATITKGKIKDLDTTRAEAVPGVMKVFTHLNRPSLARFDLQYADMDAPPGSPFRPLDTDEVLYNGQPIALVVASGWEVARYAATLVEVLYETQTFGTDIAANLGNARPPKLGMATLLKPPPPKPRGDFEKAFNESPFQTSAEFFHGTEHHNPLELFASTVVYEGKGKLTIYDKTQGTVNSQLYVANVFGLKYKDVRVISPFVGGAFGSGLRPQYQLFLAVMAALDLHQSVRVTLDRSQMFTFGHRPPTVQQTRFGADADGRITAMHHSATGETSQFEDYTETVVNWSPMLYPADNWLMQYRLVPVDVFTPLDMRAPGGSTGMHAVECTIDALAHEAGADPLQFRLLNYAAQDESLGRPYSSKELRECFRQGAERFGWQDRNPIPRSMKRGHKLVGYGMATGIWEANQLPAKAGMLLTAEGKLKVSSAVTDIGTGTFTVMAQIAADELGMPIADVEFGYGDSKMPFAPIQGGSFTTTTVGAAIRATARALRKKLYKIAVKTGGGIWKGTREEDVGFENGCIVLKNDLRVRITFHDLVAGNGGKPVKASRFSVPNVLKLKKYSRAAHSAAFVEVEVDEELGVINVTRALTAVAAGRIINPKTARSQILGGMVWGISKALREETIADHQLGKYMNQNLAEYHIPVHADIHELDVIFVDEQDDVVNELGTKGVGEIGLVAMPPAIANAVFNATGKRITNLPIHFDVLL